MYTLSNIKNWLFFDIETTTEYANFDVLAGANPHKAELWCKRCEYLRSRYSELSEKTDEELYELKGPVHPEFLKVVCVSFGIYKGNGQAQIVGFADDDEKIVISKSLEIISKFKDAVYKESPSATAYLAGHNIKRFDVPVLAKRALINKLELPDMLLVHDKKPWEMAFVDTAEVWSFGAWQESFTSLDLLANSLGLESSKSEMAGDQVQNAYWEQQRLDDIRTYCKKDVIVTMNVILELSGLPHVSVEEYSK